jgi:hypothetical protein
MSLRDRIQQDGTSVFLNSEEFAEEITYATETDSKVIKAIVVRYELAPAEENINRSLKKQAEIYIANDPIEGVVTVSKKDDRITLKDTEGTERESRINDVLNRDDGIWHLLVGW